MEDLFTRIQLESFEQLAAHVAAAVDPSADARTRLLAYSRAYHAWAVAHPRQFNLLFTDQIPDYRAPAAGTTVEAELAIFRPMVKAVSELAKKDFSIEDLAGGSAVSLDVKATVYGLFAALHGFVLLEINNHASVLRGSDEVLIAHMTRAIDDVAAKAARG